MTKITLISSGQPSANPRLVKEAKTLEQAGYNVTVIYVPISPWADVFDKALFHKHPQIKFIQAGYHPFRQKLLYKLARVRRKALSSLYQRAGDILNVADYSTILFGQELLKAAKRHKADLYIAHNLGALPAAVKAARFHEAKVGFDAEDFHRGEFSTNSLEKQQTEFIENKYFPEVNYLTVASPLIGEAYKALFPELSPVVIHNVFPVSGLSELKAKGGVAGLRLFWFSQTIGRGRGLEQVIKAIGLLKHASVSLTLLGNHSSEMHDYLLKIAEEASLDPRQLHFMAPVAEDELFKIAAEFDIGIGAEVPDSLNREYCLTNKIYTYLLAANALVLSDTQAQRQFLEENPGIGFLYKNGDPVGLANVLRKYLNDTGLLREHQQNARSLAKARYNWEIESQKFLKVVQSTLAKN